MKKLINRILEDGNPKQLDEMVELLADLTMARTSGDSERTKLIEFICEFFSREDLGVTLEYSDRKVRVHLTDEDNHSTERSFELHDGESILECHDDFLASL